MDKIYKCADCQRKLKMSDVTGVRLDGWRWFSWRNYFYQGGILLNIIMLLMVLVSILSYYEN